jgi:hypothetical protein
VIVAVHTVPSYLGQRWVARSLVTALWRRYPRDIVSIAGAISITILLLSSLPLYWISDIQGDVQRWNVWMLAQLVRH